MAVVREWVAKAENDLKSAAYLLKMRGCPVDNVCFNAQQCVEKYLKALLITQRLEFPKTTTWENCSFFCRRGFAHLWTTRNRISSRTMLLLRVILAITNQSRWRRLGRRSKSRVGCSVKLESFWPISHCSKV
jgi:hypothetical protein